MDEIKVGVIGYGLAGRAFHAPFIAAAAGLRLTTVVTGSPERAAAVAERYPDATVVSTVDELWRSGLDLVVVASPNRHHVAQAAAALDAGLHVVVDKPVAATGAEIRDLADRADRAGRMLTVFQNRRWDGDFRTVRDLVADGTLGAVTRFESRFERASRSARTAWKASQDPADLADIRYDLGSHVADQAIALFGRPVSVHAEATPSPVANDATILLTHAGGVRSYLRMSSVTTPAAPRFVVTGMDAGYRSWGLDPQEKASVAGRLPTDAGFGEYPEELWGQLVTDEGVRAVPTQPGAYLGFYQSVAACVLGDGPPPVPLSDSVDLVDTLEAAIKSADTGVPVAI
ncbi:Myo-inositol 2-dehydrogenase [Alloactinosynnema sp. L-07]|uniref:Gfo/Idh/MocA family oxidoreductase n=1 Tax=Alloactinosynnema sp. L-07 TaxID=1653480 RepID=UPI00065EFF6E|nr:Gfo/Idh/MocA family oxidoreductase [Alloactinosynnema sp. L-07]CRK56249.1 Myo-inositol 2-dehydrogenase [Alloactinosynnema sp. L-07]